jgi:SdrD B-like domain
MLSHPRQSFRPFPDNEDGPTMQLWSGLWHSLRRHVRAGKSPSMPPAPRSQPLLECLEDRLVPSAVSSITGNFNGTAIPANDTLWFSSVAKVQGLGSGPATIHLTNQSISFEANGASYQYSVPDATLTLSPSATTAVASFNAATNSWNTTVPTHFSGNTFLSALAVPLPSGLPGGIQNVTWQLTATSNTAGLSINWQWAAAAYSTFSANEAASNVKAVDDNHFAPFANSDHAGTPENFQPFVVGGATGGGGSNFTGSYSATGSFTPPVVATITGSVVNDANNTGVAGIQITLTGTTAQGQTVTMTTFTDQNGSFQFDNLSAGVYSISEQLPSNLMADHNTAGSAGGVSSQNQFTGISLNSGINAGGYLFGDLVSNGGS